MMLFFAVATSEHQLGKAVKKGHSGILALGDFNMGALVQQCFNASSEIMQKLQKVTNLHLHNPTKSSATNVGLWMQESQNPTLMPLHCLWTRSTWLKVPPRLKVQPRPNTGIGMPGKDTDFSDKSH